ncbi:MAG: hypothetical protein GTO33_01030 [Acidobacteria bacterium]|nr:hypothetical protein [Acidobacteriota bacterium]NIO57969.1 hypothetical protein [Acidobacteriota bacterium]NIQ83446.1 hypothetical protein [Acidobacteriota bacterium]NIT09691.1 hypothetical protein [Acidobacteriota bacterium]
MLAAVLGCAANVDSQHEAWLVDVTADVGLDFTYRTGATGELHMPEIMGGGVAFIDYDGDGDPDVYATNGNASPAKPARGGEIGDRLFRNDDGRFTDVTSETGLGDTGYGMGVAVADFDGDGDADLYVSNFGEDRLYRNDGGRFVDFTADSGIVAPGWSASAVWCDYDLDGALDLYVTRYVDYSAEKRCRDPASRPAYCGPLEFPPVSDLLFRNLGSGRFEDVSTSSGIASVRAAGLGVVCEDLDDDGWPDFYVANDAYANQLWLNRRDGTFVDRAVLLGAAFNIHGEPEAGMGVVAADFDNDLRSDLFVTHLAAETNTYYRNVGAGKGFADATGEVGLAVSSMALTGFGTVAFDVDFDGDLDLAVVNGRVKRTDPRPDSWVDEPWSWFAEPNLFYVNESGALFRGGAAATAPFTDPVEISRGLTLGDYDGDGDQDLLAANIESPLRVYRNDAPKEGRWVVLRLSDPGANREAIGARVTVLAGDLRQRRTMTRGSSYLSSRDASLHIGIGAAASADVTVTWPDGKRETFNAVPADGETTLIRGTGTPSS